MWTTPHRAGAAQAQPSCSTSSSARAPACCVRCVRPQLSRPAAATAAEPERRQQLPGGAAALGAAATAQLASLVGAAQAAAEGAAAAVGPVDPSTYVPSPMEPGWQVWFGAIVGVVPFVIGAYEFTKRILIQRRCRVCEGSGLVLRGKYPKKCPECGGMFPWVSWRMFLSATATPGNGGPLLQPKGQTSVFYSVPPPLDGGGGGGGEADAQGDSGREAAAAAAPREGSGGGAPPTQ